MGFTIRSLLGGTLEQTVQLVEVRIDVPNQLIQRHRFHLTHRKYSIIQPGTGAYPECSLQWFIER